MHSVFPRLGANDLLVRCVWSGVSVGTEFAVIRNKINYGPYPVCTGYQAVGYVEDAGVDVTKFEVGDKVYYRRSYLPMIVDGQPGTVCSGAHSSYALMPEDAEVEHLPEGVDEATAALFVMPAVGYNAVDMAGVQMGDVVAIHAVGLIGLGALAAARLRGAETIAIDLNSQRLEMAKVMGAAHTIDASRLTPDELVARVQEIQPEGADVVFEGSGVPSCLDLAFPLARLRGKFVFLGHYGKEPVSFNYLVPHGNSLRRSFPATMDWRLVGRRCCEILPAGPFPGRRRLRTGWRLLRHRSCMQGSTGTRRRSCSGRLFAGVRLLSGLWFGPASKGKTLRKWDPGSL